MKKSKIACLADLHFALYGQDRLDKELNYPLRLTGIYRTLIFILQWCVDNDIPIVAILGDVFHTMKLIHTDANHLLQKALKKFEGLLRFYIIPGNHDLSNKTEDANTTLSGIDNMKHITLINKPTIILDDILVAPFSYGEEMLRAIKEGTQKYLFSHFGLNEAKLQSGISIISHLKLSDVKQYQKVILGHYHKPQNLGNVWYTGSTTHLDWGDKGDEKRFLILDLNSGEIESIPTNGHFKFYEFEIDEQTNMVDLRSKIRQLEAEGHKVRLRKLSPVEIPKSLESSIIIDETEKDITNRGITSSMDDSKKFEKYLEIRDIKEEDRKNYLNVVNTIVN